MFLCMRQQSSILGIDWDLSVLTVTQCNSTLSFRVHSSTGQQNSVLKSSSKCSPAWTIRNINTTEHIEVWVVGLLRKPPGDRSQSYSTSGIGPSSPDHLWSIIPISNSGIWHSIHPAMLSVSTQDLHLAISVGCGMIPIPTLCGPGVYYKGQL